MAITGVALWRLNYMRKKDIQREGTGKTSAKGHRHIRMIKENTGTDSMI